MVKIGQGYKVDWANVKKNIWTNVDRGAREGDRKVRLGQVSQVRSI